MAIELKRLRADVILTNKKVEEASITSKKAARAFSESLTSAKRKKKLLSKFKRNYREKVAYAVDKLEEEGIENIPSPEIDAEGELDISLLDNLE